MELSEQLLVSKRVNIDDHIECYLSGEDEQSFTVYKVAVVIPLDDLVQPIVVTRPL